MLFRSRQCTHTTATMVSRQQAIPSSYVLLTSLPPRNSSWLRSKRIAMVKTSAQGPADKREQPGGEQIRVTASTNVPTVAKPTLTALGKFHDTTVHSSIFCFTNDLTLVSYAPGRNKTVILSSQHHDDKHGRRKRSQTGNHHAIQCH